MEYLQYLYSDTAFSNSDLSFKPCYKWNTFNTKVEEMFDGEDIISFKPCYKWNTFNTFKDIMLVRKILKF